MMKGSEIPGARGIATLRPEFISLLLELQAICRNYGRLHSALCKVEDNLLGLHSQTLANMPTLPFLPPPIPSFFTKKKDNICVEKKLGPASSQMITNDQLKRYGGHISLTSFPRSGNSFTRSIVERITGNVTGSDVRPDRALSVALRKKGFMGEGSVNSNVEVVKTHFPERSGWKLYSCDRAILVIRNPFDAVNSYFNFILTSSHTKTVKDSEYSMKRWGDICFQN